MVNARMRASELLRHRVPPIAARNDALVIAQQDDTIRIAHRRAAVEVACDCQILIGPCFRSPGGLKRPHSVLTFNLRDEGATKAAERRVIEFLRERTSVAPPNRHDKAAP
jgi:hypothetical protein